MRKLLSFAVVAASLAALYGLAPGGASATEATGATAARAANAPPAAAAVGCTDPSPRWFDRYSQENGPTNAGGANAWGYIWVDPPIDPDADTKWYRTCVEITVKDTAADGMGAVAWVTFTTRDGRNVRFTLDRADGYGNSVSRTYEFPPSRDFYVYVCRAAGANWTDHCSANG